MLPDRQRAALSADQQADLDRLLAECRRRSIDGPKGIAEVLAVQVVALWAELESLRGYVQDMEAR